MGEVRQAELTPEERCDRVKAALSEAGWPKALAQFSQTHDTVRVRQNGPDDPPPDVAWRACAVCGETPLCWPCCIGSWRGELDWRDCDHDPMTSPWPPSTDLAESEDAL